MVFDVCEGVGKIVFFELFGVVGWVLDGDGFVFLVCLGFGCGVLVCFVVVG